ncbi:hypothetical protein DPMN_038083 [Dreissena polymorpha]|uniref:Uncharacterized protein n=1 Tax=Dreissena polymorpha TaxID=45954 RepID=A0A9D4RQD4_DREPO|nr:hypothetical protein DPMN_038083 [Dreissena polymorpha]
MIQLGKSRAININTEATVAPLSRDINGSLGERLLTEGLHVDDECRSAIHNHPIT